MINDDTMTKIDRQVYRAVHGKKVVLDALMAAGKGWNHSTGHTSVDHYEQWRRGRWTLTMEWSEGGRIKGAGLHEDQVDPDTGKIKLRPNGDPVRFLRFGLTAGARHKKEQLIELLTTPPDELGKKIHAMRDKRLE